MRSANTFHLSFDDHVHNFDAAQQYPGAPKRLESQHGPSAPLDRLMILLDEVIQTPSRARHSEALTSQSNEGLQRSSRWALRRKSILLSSLSSRPMERFPADPDVDVRFVHSPALSNWPLAKAKGIR